MVKVKDNSDIINLPLMHIMESICITREQLTMEIYTPGERNPLQLDVLTLTQKH